MYWLCMPGGQDKCRSGGVSVDTECVFIYLLIFSLLNDALSETKSI
jgi:hypothetical protein